MASGKTDKLVEVDAESHAALKKYCREQGLEMKSYLSGVILNEVRNKRALLRKIQGGRG